jgi:hypothetical protein
VTPDITRYAAALLAGVLLLAGCSSAAPEPAPPTAAPTAAQPAVAIRDIDVSQAPFATDLTRRAGGGEVPRERVRYLDLTGDGVEEAVAVVESGGTLGDIGVGVFQANGSSAALAYFRKLAGRVEMRDRTIVVVEGAPAAGDPACCPAKLRETAIEWRSGSFEVTSERVVNNPSGGTGEPGY